jgi:hypothetical protein
MFFNSHEIYLNLDGEDEIRLLILGPGTKSDPIYCHLKHANLSGNPVYEAVSYMWGTDSPSCPINISGYTEHVRENLNDALIQLRRPHDTRVLWIDALCINQDDKQERNQQVAQMGMIYSKAENVCISLGRKGSRAGTLRPKHAQETFDFMTKVSAFVNVKDSLVDLVHSIEELVWVMNFFSLQYWKRLWIIQEVVLAAKLEIYWVESVIPWETLQEFLQVVRSCKASGLENAPAEIDTVIHNGLTNPVPYRLYLQRQLAEESSIARQTPILDLVKTYADAECAETRDKVFALLSFASECCRIAVPVDYTYSTYQLCNKLSRHHLQSHLNSPDRSSDLEWIVCHLNNIRRLIGEGSARERPNEGCPHFFNPKQYLAIFTDPHDGETNAARGELLTVRGYLATTIREVTPSLKSIQVRKKKDYVYPYADLFYIQDKPLMNCLHTNPKDSMTNDQLAKEGQNVLKLLAHEALFSIEAITWENHPRNRNGSSNYKDFPHIGGCLPIYGLEQYLSQPASLANFILLMIECFQTHPGHNDCVLFLADHDTIGIAPPATRPGDKILIFNDERTTPKRDGIDKSTADVLAVVRSVNGKHEIMGRARSFTFPSDFFTSVHRKDDVEFEIDVPGVLLLSRATYSEPFLMMSEAWRDERRNRSEFNVVKRMMEVNSLLSKERVEHDVSGNDDLATYDRDYADGNETVGEYAAEGYASGDYVVENDIEPADTKFLGLSLKPFVRRKWSQLKARLEN